MKGNRMHNLCSWRKSLQASRPVKKRRRKKKKGRACVGFSSSQKKRKNEKKGRAYCRLLILSNPPAVQDCLCKASRMEQKIYFLAGSPRKQQIRFRSLLTKISKSHCHVVYSECVLGCSEGESTFDK